ncbi:MAG: dihydropteroate synthase [Myxococcota bacterium]
MLDFKVVHRLLKAHGEALQHEIRPFQIGPHAFDFASKRYLTGVINLSTDSWYKESVCRTTDEAIARGEQLAADGAVMIDVGAESTLPDARRVDVKGQLEMLLPVVDGLIARNLVVSVESYHPEVLDTCARHGAQVFNLTGMREADEVFRVAGTHGAAVILCYVQGETVREVGDFEQSEDMVPVLLDHFRALTSKAATHGVTKCFIDPGLGFYYKNLQDSVKRVSYQMDTFLHAFRLWSLGFPIFNIVPHAPEVFLEDERRKAEPFFAVLAALGGTHMIRTHEVRALSRVMQALEIYRAQ